MALFFLAGRAGGVWVWAAQDFSNFLLVTRVVSVSLWISLLSGATWARANISSLPALPLSLFYELGLCLSIVLFVSSHLSMFSLVFFFRTATTSWCCYSLFFSFCIQISSYFFCWAHYPSMNRRTQEQAKGSENQIKPKRGEETYVCCWSMRGLIYISFLIVRSDDRPGE